MQQRGMRFSYLHVTTTEDEWVDLVLSTKPELLICFGPYRPSLQKGMKVEESMQAFSNPL